MGIEDGVAVVFQVGRLEATWSRLEAVEEEDGHVKLSICTNFLQMA